MIHVREATPVALGKGTNADLRRCCRSNHPTPFQPPTQSGKLRGERLIQSSAPGYSLASNGNQRKNQSWMKKHREQPKLLVVTPAGGTWSPCTGDIRLWALGRSPSGSRRLRGGEGATLPWVRAPRASARRHRGALLKGNSQNPSGCFLSQQEM